MPAFGLPVLSLIFVVESFLLQIYWIKPSIFVREVRMKCLRRFILRCRGSHGWASIHALRSVSLPFLKSARFFKNTDTSECGAPDSRGSPVHRTQRCASLQVSVQTIKSRFVGVARKLANRIYRRNNGARILRSRP